MRTTSSTELWSYHGFLATALQSEAVVEASDVNLQQVRERFDDQWRAMMAAGLRCFFEIGDRPGRPVDHAVVNYLEFVVKRDGFQTDAFYWAKCLEFWELYQWCGVDVAFYPPAA